MAEIAEQAVDPALARSMIEPLYQSRSLPTGEPTLSHADGMASILREIKDDPEMIAAAYLFYVPVVITNSSEWVRKSFGTSVDRLVQELSKANRLSDLASSDHADAGNKQQIEAMRRMLLAMCSDLRVVLLKLASRLQTLRWFTVSHNEALSARFGAETLDLYAPLANRLGIWQIKWELEDLSLRFTRPEEYHAIARQLDESREERLDFMKTAVQKIRELLAKNHIQADVSGRPKHIYSIWKKMQRKHLRFDQLFDVRALRIIVETVEQCYQVLGIVQQSYPVLSKEYDDYIAKPKPNGYQSLHTVVTDKAGRPIEIQIRTRAMHEYAELGVAAHWRYKEAGNSNGATTAEEQRVAWLRQMLAWNTDVMHQHKPEGQAVTDDHVYCLTPQGRVVELPVGSTPVDFAYAVHTELGHRTRGARVDGAMVPLNTPLKTGQTVEIIAGKEGQPSRDWLTPELGFAVSARTRNKVRQWFNAQHTAELIAEGRDKVDKELARQGKTAVKLEDLAKRLGFEKIEDLCLAYAKEELTQTALATALQPPAPPAPEPEVVVRASKQKKNSSGVLVVGVDSLLTQLARCCRPVPPDEIVGYVTRGRGVTIHRADCPNIRNMAAQDRDRLIEVSWGNRSEESVYPVDVLVVTVDRQGMLRDISEIFAKAKQNLTGMQTSKVKELYHIKLTVEIPSAESLAGTLKEVRSLKGVLSARRL
ncbi:MAG: GTP pyrophosphokinase [Burkholderia sp.]|jgi:GTP pyrophosphokinase